MSKREELYRKRQPYDVPLWAKHFRDNEWVFFKVVVECQEVQHTHSQGTFFVEDETTSGIVFIVLIRDEKPGIRREWVGKRQRATIRLKLVFQIGKTENGHGYGSDLLWDKSS